MEILAFGLFCLLVGIMLGDFMAEGRGKNE